MRSFIPLLLLAACSAEPEPPGQVSPDEARELNEAAEMLDANSIHLNAVGNNEAEDAR